MNAIERLKLIKTLKQERAALQAAVTTMARLKAAKSLLDIRRKLGFGSTASTTTSRKQAIEETAARIASIRTPDNLVWAVSKKALGKSTAHENKDGEKPFQRERIAAIQQLDNLAAAANIPPLVRDDDGQDSEIDKIYEYLAPFDFEGKTFKARLLCKKWKPELSREDRYHSLSMLLDSALAPFFAEGVPSGTAPTLGATVGGRLWSPPPRNGKADHTLDDAGNQGAPGVEAANAAGVDVDGFVVDVEIVASAISPDAPPEIPEIEMLRQIAAGRFDDGGDLAALTALYARIRAAVEALDARGALIGEAGEAANAAIGHWADLEVKSDV